MENLSGLARLTGLIGWLSIMTPCSLSSEEIATQYAERFFKEMREEGYSIAFDRIICAEDAGLSVTVSPMEPQILLGMPLLFDVNIVNQSPDVRRVLAVDSGTNGLWLPKYPGLAEQDPHFVVVDLETKELFEAGLSSHHGLGESLARWRIFEPYRRLAPLEAVVGQVDVSPLHGARAGLFVQKAGKFLLLLIWFEQVGLSLTAILAQAPFEIYEPTGQDADAWAEIKGALSGYRDPPSEVLSPMVGLWNSKLQRVAEAYPLSAYAKYMHFKKACDQEANYTPRGDRRDYSASLQAFLEVVRRYPDWALADDALLGYARCCYLEGLKLEGDQAAALFVAARDSLRTLPLRHPQTNCMRGAKHWLQQVEEVMRARGIPRD